MRTSDPKERKDTPVYSGVLAYFPDALAAVAAVSRAGNDQHNPGTPLHWDRSKSSDEYDACTRHLLDRAAGDELDSDGQRHMAKVAWRALAALQKEIENSKSQKNAEPKFVYDAEEVMTDAELRLKHSREGTPEPRTSRLTLRPGSSYSHMNGDYIERLNKGWRGDVK